MSELQVFESRPARPQMAGWVRNLLDPVITMLRLEGTSVSIEFTPLKNAAGLADNRRADGRIFINSQAKFWTKGQVVGTYLHEVAHRVGRMDHGPVFFLVLAALHFRARLDLNTLKLYDFQDQPPELSHLTDSEWRASVLQFVLSNFQQVADSEIAAEQIAALAGQLWNEHTEKMKADGLEQEKARLMLNPSYKIWMLVLNALEEFGPVKAASFCSAVLMTLVILNAIVIKHF